MSSIDFAALRGETSPRDHPEDGTHIARLERIVLHEGDRGPRLITEWSDEDNVMWTSWNRFDPDLYGLARTQQLLDGLGVDRSKLTDSNFTDELQTVEGGVFRVRTTSRQGQQGDKWFTDTFVEAHVGNTQASSDTPADTRDLPEEQPVTVNRGQAPSSSSSGLFDDDDIPF